MAQRFVKLLSGYKLGEIQLANRVVMAPLYRGRCDIKTGVPTDSVVEFYRQRSSAGLIITGCTSISEIGTAYIGAGGIYTQDQVDGWKKVTQAVHEQGGKIFLQIWHGGRVSHPANINNQQPIAPSPVAIRESIMTPLGELPFEVPREMTQEDIVQVIQEFRKGAENAKEAGFDGVELHGANGYLVDEFLRDWTNRRQDEWGGSSENRIRFCLEVFGAGRVGIKLTPVGRFRDMYDNDPQTTYRLLAQELDKRNIAYISTLEPSLTDMDNQNKPDFKNASEQISCVMDFFRQYYNGTIISNLEYTPEKAELILDSGRAHCIAFGRLFIGNPDLVERFTYGYPLAESNPKYWLGGGDEGYIDYPNYIVQ